MGNDALLEKLAASISEGVDVDWKDEESLATTSEARSWVRNLRAVSEIARCSSDPEGGDLQTVIVDEAPPSGKPLGTWGHLRLIEMIGQGGFGEVYRAEDTRLQRDVALKLLKPMEPGRESKTVSILREGRLMAKVEHPNVVTVHGAEEHDGRVGIWMEFIRGNTLETLLKAQGKLGDREAADIGLSLCRALAAVHGKGLVHSDIKAQNVMRAEGGRIVLMDFNTVRETAADGEIQSVSGTPLYMPPEAFSGQPASVRGDIYGVGVLLYHLVSGTYPVVADSISSLRKEHMKGSPRLLRDVRSDLSEGFVAVVEKALAHDPEDRFETIGQMQQALAKWMGMGKQEEGTAPAPSPGKPWMLLGIAAVVLLAASLVLFAVLRPSAPVESDAGAAAASAAQVPAGTYAVEASLYRQNGSAAERLVPGARVSVGEELYMDFSATEDLYVYVLNHDLNGETYVLFPHPLGDLTNPLPAGVRHQLPGPSRENGQQIRWQLTSAGGREQILIMASPHKLEDVENILASVPAGQFGALDAQTTIRLRGMGGVATGGPSTPDPSGTKLFEDVKRLADSSERTSGVWMRQIDLENPPEQ